MVLFPFNFSGGKLGSANFQPVDLHGERCATFVICGRKRGTMWSFAGGKDETRATFEGSFRLVFAEESHQQV